MAEEQARSESELYAVDLVVNGAASTVEVDAEELLADTLRERVGCLSVRQSCGIGICGTCTVVVDGRSVNSCSVLTVQAGDAQVLTSEGLPETDGSATRVQRAFAEAGAFQCSFCIPGFVLTIEALLARVPDASAARIMKEIEGNLCRCGSYPRIFAAIERLAAGSDQ